MKLLQRANGTDVRDSTVDAGDTGTGDQAEQATDSDGPTTETESGDCALSKDDVFGILQNQRRRYALKYLLTEDRRVSLGELAEQIAAWENDKGLDEITYSERKRVYVGLYQCHLPKMDDVGVVDFNRDRGHVDPRPGAARYAQYLDWTDDEQDAAGATPVGFAAVGVAALVGTAYLSPVLPTLVRYTVPLVLGLVVLGVLALSLQGLDLRERIETVF